MATPQRGTSYPNRPFSYKLRRFIKTLPDHPAKMAIIFGVIILLLAVAIIAAALVDKNRSEAITDTTAPVAMLDSVTPYTLSHDTALSVQTLGGLPLSLSSDTVKQQMLSFYASDGTRFPMVFDESIDGNQLQPDLLSRIAAASLYNEETTGWIRIKGSNMNFAVVQDMNSNLTYEGLRYDGASSANWYRNPSNIDEHGVIWASRYSVLTSRSELLDNTVLFGHNWSNIYLPARVGSDTDYMFEQLAAYHTADYAQEHPYINFSIKEENLTWVVVSAMFCEDDWTNSSYGSGLSYNYITSTFGEGEKESFISEIVTRSEVLSDIELTADDKFLTLSTCTLAFGSAKTQRFVVVAKLINADEELPEVTYTQNPNPKRKGT